MSTLDLVNQQIQAIEARVNELTTRKQQLLMQVSNLFDEDSANVTGELTAIEAKLSSAPKQLNALRAQKAQLECDIMHEQVEPLLNEYSVEQERQRQFQAWLYQQEYLAKFARSQVAYLSNQQLPGIRNRLYALIHNMLGLGLSEADGAMIKARMERLDVKRGFTDQEKMQFEAQARADFKAQWGDVPTGAGVPIVPAPSQLPPGFRQLTGNAEYGMRPQPGEIEYGMPVSGW